VEELKRNSYKDESSFHYSLIGRFVWIYVIQTTNFLSC